MNPTTTNTTNTTNDKEKPSYRSAAYTEMACMWPYVSDVIKGTLHLRKLGKKYLPQFPAEDNDVYKDRLETAVCFDATRQTLNGLVGMIFRKQPQLGQTVPQVIKDHLENADLAGKHWQVFVKDVADSAEEFGHSFIVADMQPDIDEGANAARQVTHEDEIKTGRRPYWIHYKANQAINWNTVEVKGQTVLEQITFEEVKCEKDGRFGQKLITRYRVFFLDNDQVKWELWRKVSSEGKEEIIIENEGTFKNVTEIPLSVVYAAETGFLTSRPPLLNLALYNIKHYQQSSDFDNTLHVCGYPMYCSDDAGADESALKPSGPSIHHRLPQGSKSWYAEPTGSSLQWQDKNLENKKQEMAVMGISFLAERVQVEQTATEQKIKSSERTSDLADFARSIKDGVERSLGLHAQFIGMKPEQGGTIEIADPAELVLSAEQIRLMSDEVMRGQMSLETYWAMKAKAGLQPDGFDPVLERERIGQMQPAI